MITLKFKYFAIKEREEGLCFIWKQQQKFT